MYFDYNGSASLGCGKHYYHHAGCTAVDVVEGLSKGFKNKF